LTDCTKYAAGFYEDNVVPLLMPPARNREQYKSVLNEIILKNGIDALVATSDHDMEAVMDLLHRGWDPPVRMFRPDFEAYRILSHKGRLTSRLRELGFNVPRLFGINDDRTFPVVIKPSSEGGTKGVWIAHNESEFRMYYRAVENQFGGDIVVQEFIPGGVGTLHIALLLYGHDGKVCGEAVSQSHLTFMSWGGGGNAGVVIERPELLEQAKRIIEAIGGWRGPINLEFKLHSENHLYYLLEANCRLNGYSYLMTMNGMNFPLAIVEILSSGKTDFLSLNKHQQTLNFVIGFRETPIERWAT